MFTPFRASTSSQTLFNIRDYNLLLITVSYYFFYGLKTVSLYKASVTTLLVIAYRALYYASILIGLLL